MGYQRQAMVMAQVKACLQAINRLLNKEGLATPRFICNYEGGLCPPFCLGAQVRYAILKIMNIATQQEPLQKLIQQIVELVHPAKIIVFGSVARGTPGPESDIDLLVVMPEGIHRRHTAQLIYKRVQGIRTPFDVLVTTASDLEKNKENPGLIYKRILEEGEQVYAA